MTTSLPVAFVALGLLVGSLTGLSASPIATVVVPASFALFGGSLLALLSKVSREDREVVARCIIAFSAVCWIATLSSIWVTTHQLLGPPRSGADLYLRGATLNQVTVIDQQYRSHILTADDAYKQLFQLVAGKGH
jgi:hypothetical protein